MMMMRSMVFASPSSIESTVKLVLYVVPRLCSLVTSFHMWCMGINCLSYMHIVFYSDVGYSNTHF